MGPELTSDGQLRIGQTLLDAEATGILIHRLAQLRAQMQPPVTRKWAAVKDVHLVREPDFKVGLSHDGLLLIALRHDGFGWCCFELELGAAASLRDFIAKRTSGIADRSLDDFSGRVQ